SAGSAKQIRTARRMAASLHVEWIAVHVETPQFQVSESQRNIVIQNLRLAEQLGAETKILTGLDRVKEIINFAHEQNITRIVLGKHIKPRWKTLFFRSFADAIIQQSGEI